MRAGVQLELTSLHDPTYGDGHVKTYQIPIGSLPPCRQVGISDGGRLEKSGEAKGVERLTTYVYFVDSSGNKWKRYVGQEPVEVDSVPQVDLTSQGTSYISGQTFGG